MKKNIPFPNPIAADALIADQANAIGFLSPYDNLRGRRVLDAGCGTGERLMALAQAFPHADFTGIDMTAASLETAEELARDHEINNVHLIQHNLLQKLPEQFDLIISAGVVHHLEYPQAGLENLCTALSDDGLLMLWLYHKYGEFTRLLNRDLALLFWKHMNRPKGSDKIKLLQQLGFSVPLEHYGTISSRQSQDTTQSSIDIDAYLHPIVNTYTFGDAFTMLRRCRVDWIAPNGINWQHQSKLIDLGNVYEDTFFTVTSSDLFQDEQLQAVYQELSAEEKIAAIELVIRPTGFTVLAGRSRSYHLVEPRVEKNLV